MPQKSELTSLEDLSARVGADPLLVQAGTGNTSIKLGGVLWIKASGKWLAHAKDEEMFVAVDLAKVRECLRESRALAECYDASADSLKPSIETSMHAVLPHRVVLHVHSINTIAWAVRRDGLLQAAERLAGLRWRWIPYAPSGRPLAKEIEKALATSPDTDVFILANHGLVVCGDSTDAAEQLLYDVEKRVAIRPRPTPAPDYRELMRAAAGAPWCLPHSKAFHSLGADEVSRAILSGGTLYPCQAIFFGADMPPRFVSIQGAGALFAKDITRTQRAMLAGLVEVLRRIEASAPISYLTQREVEDALSVEAYSYRAHVESWSMPYGKRVPGSSNRFRLQTDWGSRPRLESAPYVKS